MNDPEPAVNVGEVLVQTDALPYGNEKTSILTDAVARSSTLDIERQFTLQFELLRAATFGGSPDIVMATFAWCIQQFDTHPILHNREYDLLWAYKWVLNAAACYDHIPAQRIQALLDDCIRRWQSFGASDLAIATVKKNVAKALNHEYPEAVEHWEQIGETHGRGRSHLLANCQACDIASLAHAKLELSTTEAALDVVEPLLGYKLSCNSQPKSCISTFLRVLHLVGRTEEAATLQPSVYDSIANNPEYLDETAEHALYLALAERPSKAVEMVESHLSWYPKADPSQQRFTSKVWLLSVEIAAEFAPLSTRVTVPYELGVGSDDANNLVTLKTLQTWLLNQAETLAARFDARNGNPYHSNSLKNRRSLLETS